jgi:tetratricopeptide (TPR) repeat protein
MRKLWLTTFTALYCAAGFTATMVFADPASMAMGGRSNSQLPATSVWPWSKSTAVAPTAVPQPVMGQPPEQVSATHHPIKYVEANISKHFGSGNKMASAPRPTMPPVTNKADAISLSTPSGPPSPDFFIFAAQMCEQQNDVPQARKNFQKALTMWPGQVEVLRSAARMEDRQGNLPLAENLYQQAVAANPQHAGAHNDLGLCLAREGKLQPSLQALEQAVQLQPTKPLYRNNAATVLVEMHQDQRALAHLAAVHGAADANYNLGQLLVERNRSADAAPYFQAALQQNPGLQQAQEALAKLQGPQGAGAPKMAALPASPQAVAALPVVTQPIAAPPIATQPFAPQAVAVQPIASNVPMQYGQPIGAQQFAPANQQVNYPAPAGAPAAGMAPAPQYLPPVATRPAPQLVR